MITKEEWFRRYADQIQKRSNVSREIAMDCAEVGWEGSNQDIDNDGPEDCADVELSYWDND